MLSKGAMPKSSACTSGCVGGGPTPFLVTPTLSFVEMGCANISVIPFTTFWCWPDVSLVDETSPTFTWKITMLTMALLLGVLWGKYFLL